jgi:hypothetical protein
VPPRQLGRADFLIELADPDDCSLRQEDVIAGLDQASVAAGPAETFPANTTSA